MAKCEDRPFAVQTKELVTFLIRRIIATRNQIICCYVDTRNFTSFGTNATLNATDFENE